MSKIPFTPCGVPTWDPAIKGLSKNSIIYPFRPRGFNFLAVKFADWKAKDYSNPMELEWGGNLESLAKRIQDVIGMLCALERWVLLRAVCTWPRTFLILNCPYTTLVHHGPASVFSQGRKFRGSLSVGVKTPELWFLIPVTTRFLSLGQFWFLQRGRVTQMVSGHLFIVQHAILFRL